MDRARTAGEHLAARHRRAVSGDTQADPARSLLNYAESSRADDWTLRSALVRLAQPEPVRAGAVLELIRRCDGALAPYARHLESTAVPTDPLIDVPRLLAVDTAEGETVGVDARVVELARLARTHPDEFPTILDAYQETVELDTEELTVLPLLGVAVVLDELAVGLTNWAAAEITGPPPLDLVDARCAEAFELLEELGVAREEPLRRGGRPSRGV